MAGFKTFTAGSILTASDMNTYVMQGVLVFATTSARTSAITTPTAGMMSFITATNSLEYYDGAAWQVYLGSIAWTSYTPTLTNLTLGNGTLTFTYQQVGKIVNVRGRFSLGSTSAVTGSATFSLPVTPTGFAYGSANILAAGANYGAVSYLSGTTVVVSTFNAAGTYAARTNTSATIPATFTTADAISFSLTYEAA